MNDDDNNPKLLAASAVASMALPPLGLILSVAALRRSRWALYPFCVSLTMGTTWFYFGYIFFTYNELGR